MIQDILNEQSATLAKKMANLVRDVAAARVGIKSSDEAAAARSKVMLNDYCGPQARALLEVLKRLDASLNTHEMPPFESEHLDEVRDAANL
ncbi:MAG: hypothetical protein A3F84_27750 [Candidatus Handelsmanbacteria bacterium RIFCSPLOWO2_12_FULL_64_10]|uniref:Uncharacterized protein n=1 Tax=Handelsmanbacteria sp. (strain RIFCSPLOWO2_12_FULL_64_10) TaxID=1817868 RepID=A0A1F6C4V0_HANXR|nr:MAG: hypothetical protein A3F84_27750 [Candidatus Handelsmanbacteria bacterium RIFCSPLOWO2_12_FULL_64_10]